MIVDQLKSLEKHGQWLQSDGSWMAALPRTCWSIIGHWGGRATIQPDQAFALQYANSDS